MARVNVTEGLSKKLTSSLCSPSSFTGVSYKAIAMRLRRAVEKAEKNGELKYIDRYIPGACYDYDYGYNVKELITLIYYHLSDNDLIIVKKEY